MVVLNAGGISADSILAQVVSYQERQRSADSAELLYNYLSQKKARVWTHDVEKIMKIYIGVALDSEELDRLEETLISFRLLTQESNVTSFEKIINHLLYSIKLKIDEDLKVLGKTLKYVLDNFQPFNGFLALFDKHYEVRENILRNWEKLLWANKFVMDITFGHVKLEQLYCDFTKSAIDYYLKVDVQDQVLDLLNSSLNHLKDISSSSILSSEYTDKIFDLTIYQISISCDVGAFKEAFELVKEIRKLLDLTTPLNVIFSKYFRILSRFFYSTKYFIFSCMSLIKFNEYQKKLLAAPNELDLIACEILKTFCLIDIDPRESTISEEEVKMYCFLLKDGEIPKLERFEIHNDIIEKVDKDLKKAYNWTQGEILLKNFYEETHNLCMTMEHIDKKLSYIIMKKSIHQLLFFFSKHFLSLTASTFNEYTKSFSKDTCESFIITFQLKPNKVAKFDINSKTFLFLEKEKPERVLIDIEKVKCDIHANKLINFHDTQKYESALRKESKEQWKKEQKEFILRDLDTLKKINAGIVKKDETSTGIISKKIEKENLKNRHFFAIKKERIEKLIEDYPGISILGRHLTTFPMEELIEIDLDTFDELEEKQKKKTKDKIKEILENKFYEYDYLLRKVIEQWCNIRPSMENETDIIEKRENIYNQKNTLLEKIEAALLFVNNFKEKNQQEKEKKYNKEVRDFREGLRDEYRSTLIKEAERQYKYLQEKKLKENPTSSDASLSRSKHQFTPNNMETPKLTRGNTSTLSSTNQESLLSSNTTSTTKLLKGTSYTSVVKTPLEKSDSGTQKSLIRGSTETTGLKKFTNSKREKNPETAESNN